MYDDLKGKLHGTFYTIFTPFGPDMSIDYDALKFYLHKLYEQGARRFYAMAYNSRYSQLSTDEILELNAFCIKEVKALSPDNVVVVGDPIHGSTQQSLEFTQHAKDCGADLVSLIMREKYFSDDQVLSHFDYIGRTADFPILVHEMPFLSGFDGKQMHWPDSLLHSLPKVSHIAALKEDAKNFEITKSALRLEPDIRIIIAGRKSDFMPFRELGARAYLNGISIIHAQIGERFWQAYESGDEATIAFILEKLEAPFFDGVVREFGWHRTNKALLQAAGYMHRRDRPPMPHLEDEDFAKVQAVFDEIIATLDDFL